MTAGGDREVTPAPDVSAYRAAIQAATVAALAALDEEPELTHPGLLVRKRIVGAAVDAAWPLADAAGYRRAVDRLQDADIAIVARDAARDLTYGGEQLSLAHAAKVVKLVLCEVADRLAQDAPSTQPLTPQSDVQPVPPSVPTVETPEAVGGAERVWDVPTIPEDARAVSDCDGVEWRQQANATWRRYLSENTVVLTSTDLIVSYGPLTEVRDV